MNKNRAKKEIWKDIKNYEGLYQISNTGRVKSLKRVVPHKNRWKSKTSKRIIEEKILKQNKTIHNYLFVQLYKNNKNQSNRIHRLVASAFIPNSQNKPCVNHIDGNKNNCHISNLEWCTYSENSIHAFKTGLKKISNKQKERASLLGKKTGKINIKKAIKANKKKIMCIETKETFNSLTEAAKAKRASMSSICMHIKGNKKYTRAGGYTWKYI